MSLKILKSITLEFTDGTIHTFTPEELQAIVSASKMLSIVDNFLGVANFALKLNSNIDRRLPRYG